MGTSGAPSEHPRLSTFAQKPPALPIYSDSINLGHHSLSRDQLQRRPAGPPAGPARTAPRAHLELRVASCGGRPGSEGLPLADSGRLRRARGARLAAIWPSSEASTQGRGHVTGRCGSCAGSAVGRLDGVQAEGAREGRVGGRAHHSGSAPGPVASHMAPAQVGKEQSADALQAALASRAAGHVQHGLGACRRAGAGTSRAQPDPLGTTMHHPALRRHYDLGAG